jgi:hypothetical protein
MESKLLGSKNELSEMPYIIATSKDQKSKFYFDSIADYPDFFDNLEWSQEVKRSKVYIAFKTEVNVDEISLKKVDKKFKHFSLDFYDQ